MANKIHLTEFKKGICSWNEWRQKNPEVIPDLSNQDFTGANLQGINLSNAILNNTVLEQCDLIGARLDNATLTKAKFFNAVFAPHSNLRPLSTKQREGETNKELETRAQMEVNNWEQALKDQQENPDKPEYRPASLNGANGFQVSFRNTQMDLCDLSNSNFRSPDFRNAMMVGTSLVGVVFDQADLESANLDYVDAAKADFSRSRFDNASLYCANFTEANLRGASNLRLDETVVTKTRFSPHANDHWSILRRTYTGPRLVLNLILILCFLLPLLIKTFFFAGVGDIQIAAGGWFATLEPRIIDLQVQGLDDPTKKIIVEAYRSAETEILDQTRKLPVWKFLLGYSESNLLVATTISILVYQILRLILTSFIAPLRDAEERSGFSPAHSTLREMYPRSENLFVLLFYRLRILPLTYGWMIWPHRLNNLIVWVAIVAATINVAQWLQTEITYFS